MKIAITNTNVADLINGASLFTTGGGIPVQDQFESLKRLNIRVELQSLDEFPKGSFLCTVGELGPTDVPPLEKKQVIKKMLRKLEKTTGKKIAGLFPPEIGQECVVLECAQYLHLPIADFDPSGFRAVPYFDMNIFNVKGMDFDLTPIVVSTDTFQIFTLTDEKDYDLVEKKLGSLTKYSTNGVIFLMGETIGVDDLIKNDITSPSYSKALQFGKIKRVSKLLKELTPNRVITGKVIGKETLSSDGFLAERVVVKDEKWDLYTLIILNEVLFLLDSNGEILDSIPDRILLLEPNKIQGISGAFLEKETPVMIVTIPPEAEWQTEKTQEILGPNRFSSLLEITSY